MEIAWREWDTCLTRDSNLCNYIDLLGHLRGLRLGECRHQALRPPPAIVGTCVEGPQAVPCHCSIQDGKVVSSVELGATYH